MKVLSVWHNFCTTVIKWDGIKLIPHCSWERHLNYRATSFMDTGEYICQLLTRLFMELPIPLPAQEAENSVCHFQKMLFSINYWTTEKQVFQHHLLTTQTGLKINGKLKSYPLLLLGQLLKYLCHLTCYLKHQWSVLLIKKFLILNYLTSHTKFQLYLMSCNSLYINSFLILKLFWPN